MNKILLLTDWFPPAYKAGGPIRSTVNFAHAMSPNYAISILSTNQDFGGDVIDVAPNKWIAFSEGIQVKYLSAETIKRKTINQEIKALKPDFIYLNSLYSIYFSMIPLLLNYQKRVGAKIVLAPRGMLQAGALQYKSIKKRGFLWLLKQINFYRGIYFHATDEQEKKDIINHLNISPTYIKVIPNFPLAVPKELPSRKKEAGDLRLVFVSRVSPKKNLAFLLERLLELSTNGSITLNVFGPQEEDYWTVCENIIKRLPGNMDVNYKGSIVHDQILEVLQDHHFFLLPTHGENFGHAIFEAFAAGLPVIISDQTPWKNLQAKDIGWDIPLSEPAQFAKAIETAINMDQTTYDQMSKAARQFATDFTEKSGLIEKYSALFSKDALE